MQSAARIPSSSGIRWLARASAPNLASVAAPRTRILQSELWCCCFQDPQLGRYRVYYSWLAWRGHCCSVNASPVIHDHSWLESSSLPLSCDVCCWKWSSQRYFLRGFSFSDQRHLSGERSVDFFWEYCGRYSRFSFYFPVFQFVHVHRTCNVVADALAKKAKNLVGIQDWSGGLPEDISQLVGFDVPWFCFFLINSQAECLLSQKQKYMWSPLLCPAPPRNSQRYTNPASSKTSRKTKVFYHFPPYKYTQLSKIKTLTLPRIFNRNT